MYIALNLLSYIQLSILVVHILTCNIHYPIFNNSVFYFSQSKTQVVTKHPCIHICMHANKFRLRYIKMNPQVSMLRNRPSVNIYSKENLIKFLYILFESQSTESMTNSHRRLSMNAPSGVIYTHNGHFPRQIVYLANYFAYGQNLEHCPL